MNKTEIEYADMTWNPITGCLRDCPYCYARQLVRRFAGYELDGETTTFNPYDGMAVLETPLEISDKFGKRRRAAFPYGFDPTLHVYRLDEPTHYHKPKTIFVGSTADLFGDWVPDEWIQAVFEVCAAAPQHTYLFLTKNPKRYFTLSADLSAHKNRWFGTTLTGSESKFPSSDRLNCFLSIEPLLSSFDGIMDLADIKGIIIGAMTGQGAKKHQPRREWIDEIVAAADDADIPVFMKKSLMPIVGEENMRRDLPWRM